MQFSVKCVVSELSRCGEMAILNREAVPPYSLGLPLRLPWVNAVYRIPNRNAVTAVLICRERDATTLRLLTVFINDPRVAGAEPRRGNAKEALASGAFSP